MARGAVSWLHRIIAALVVCGVFAFALNQQWYAHRFAMSLIREAEKIGYGPASPYAREPEYSTVAAVTRQDLLDWHAAHVHPNNIILSFTGDFDPAAMEVLDSVGRVVEE